MARADWFSYRQSIGDRTSLFRAVGEMINPAHVLYLGSYVDLSPSMIWPGVTYVDIDERARKFFSDEGLMAKQLSRRIYKPQPSNVRFVHGDFNENLNLTPGSFDLVISLYSGPSLESALRYLAPGGVLLTNNSHADSSLGILSDQLKPMAAVAHREGKYSVISDRKDEYFAFKHPEKVSEETLMRSGRGASLVRPSFGHLFVKY